MKTTTILNGSTAPAQPATDMNLYVLNYSGTHFGYPVAGIVGGNGASILDAMTDAAAKLHAMGYLNLTLSPR